jgi:hypothetical protein
MAQQWRGWWIKESWEHEQQDKWQQNHGKWAKESWCGDNDPYNRHRWTGSAESEEAPLQDRAQKAEPCADPSWGSWQYACSVEKAAKEKNGVQEKARGRYEEYQDEEWRHAAGASSWGLAAGEPPETTDSIADFSDDESNGGEFVRKWRRFIRDEVRKHISVEDCKKRKSRRHPQQQCPNGHGPCNISAAKMKKADNFVVSNARTVQNDGQLWDMCNHLSSTVLQYNDNLQGDLFKLLTLGMPDRYKAQYCIAKANRFILVKCLACGCGMYGKYGYNDHEDQEDTIRVLAAFVNRKLEASAAHL